MGIFGSRSDGKGGAGAGIRSPFVAEGRTERPQNPTVLPWQRPHEPNLCALRKQRWRRARGPPRPHGAAPPRTPGAIGAVRGGGQHAVYFNFSESFEGDFPPPLLNSDEPLGRLGRMWFRALFFFLLYFFCCCCNILLLTLSGRVPQGHLHPGVPAVGGDPTKALGVPSHAHPSPVAQHVLPWPSPQEMGIGGQNMEISPKPRFISSWCCRFHSPACSLPVHHCISWARRAGESTQCTHGHAVHTQTCSDHTLQVAARSCMGKMHGDRSQGLGEI